MSVALRGEEDIGMVIVKQKPLMAEVRIREESSASLSFGMSRDRNWTRGLIMNEFQRNDSSKLSIWKELELTGLDDIISHKLTKARFGPLYLSCTRFVRSKSVL